MQKDLQEADVIVLLKNNAVQIKYGQMSKRNVYVILNLHWLMIYVQNAQLDQLQLLMVNHVSVLKVVEYLMIKNGYARADAILINHG